NADSQINVNGGSLTATQVTNNGTFTVAGESTLNIAAVAAGSNDIELSEGTILKDSTIMGDVGVTGNVIFRGKNVLNNLYDFGEYDGAYGNTDWAKWTVEAGSQLFLEQTVTGLGNNLYGVGYGDTVVINGKLTDAAAAREAGLTKDDASFYSKTGVRFSSAAGWATSYFTVNNAYVILGTEGSFSNSAKNGGSHEITFNNALVDAAQFYFSESTATFKMTINDSDIKTAIFMTADKDSVYTLSGSKVVTTGTGTDRYNGNDGALTLTDSEIEVESGSYKNNGTIVMDAKSKLTAATLTGTGTITIDASEVTGDYVKVIELNGTASIEDMVTVSGLKEGYSVVYGSDGDVILTTASANTLYVNSAYTGAVGSQVAGEAGKIIGYNAFSNITDAIKAAEQNGGATIDLGTKKYSGNMNGPANAGLFQTNGTYTFTGGDYVDFAYVDTPRPSAENAGKVDVNIVFDNAKVTAGKFRLDNGATLTIKDSYVDAQSASGASVGWTTFYGDSKISVSNSVIGWFTLNQDAESSTITAGDKTINYYQQNGSHIGNMCYIGSGVMEVVGSTVFTYVSEGDPIALGVYDKGLMSFKDSAVYAYAFKVGVESGSKTIGRDDEVATMIFDNTTLRSSLERGDEVMIVGDGSTTAGNLIFTNGSVVDKTGAALIVNNNGVVEIDDSAVAVKTITGDGKVIANGNVTLNVDNISAQVLIGGTYENGSRVYNEERSTLNLGSATAGKAVNITKEEFRVNNADITLNSDVNVALGGGHSLNFLYLRQSALDLNGHDLTMTKGKFLLTGLDITGQGTINLSGNDAFCVQTYASTIGKDVTFISAVPANIYEDLTVYGDMTVNGQIGQGPAIVGVHTVDRKDGKITDTYTNGAVLTISGEGATYTQTGNTNMHIYGAASDDLDAEIVADLGEEYRIGASSFVIENKAVADLTQAGTLTNDGNLIVSGATLNADKIVNNSTFNITGASTLTANSITGNGKINFGDNNEKRSTINLGSATADAELTVSADKILIANTDMSLLSDVTFNSANYPVFGNGSIDMNGKTMTINSTGLACIGNGAGGLTLKDGFVVANTNHFCMQCQGNVISADVELTVNGVGRTTSMFNTYGTTAIYGKVNVNHSIWGYDNIGSNAAGFEEPANELLISGANASLNITRTDVSSGELRFTVTGGAAAGKLFVEDGASFNLTHGRVENENLISVSNGASFAADKLVNTGSVTIVDAAFTAGNVVNNGSFYANANSTVKVTGNFTSTTDLTFNGNVTIGGTLTVDNLTLAAGSDVTVNNLVVNKELNLILGAALTITTATLGNFNLTVKGNITASEYELVKGWKGEYDTTITYGGKEYTLDEATDIYSNADDTSLSFKIKDGTLVLIDNAAQAAAGSVLIDPNLTLADGESIVIGGIRYTGGVNAFKSADDIPAGKDITGVVLNNADVDAKLNNDALKDVQTVTVQGTGNTIDATVTGDTGYTLNVEAGSKLTGSTGKFEVTGDMTINNDGHLDTNAKATGAMTIVNTSANTLKGTYTATDLKIDNQVSGAIEGAILNGTVSTAISGGTGTGVTVNTPHLSLNNTKFEIAGGSILSTVKTNNGGEADTGITLTGDTDLTISKAGEISTTIREAADNVGTTTLTTVGTQTYTGDIEVDKIIIGNDVNTTLNGTVDFSDLELDGTLSIDMTSGNNYTGAGSVNGEGTLNLTHKNAWIVNDTVSRDFSGFTGTVNMTDADAQIVLGLGDAPNSTADSYFADGTTVNVAAGQKVFLAADGKNTAIEFGKDGAINVGNLSVRVIDGGTATLANNSNDFTQKLSGDNSKFTGTVNVSEGAQLTIANTLGATAINMNVEVAATGDDDDTQLNLDYEGLELDAKITGDTNDVINVTESATLKAEGAIDAFSGKVNVTD
ncbi:MAG: hypothetical protein J6S98_00920, partial [Lentisphaeria bacterium]|nr:hypothetical protein [Lentisphaeria bacterium]